MSSEVDAFLSGGVAPLSAATELEATQYRVVLDLQACQSEVSGGRGIGRYSRNFARALLESQENFSVSIALNDGFAESAEELKQAFVDVVPADRIVRYDAFAPVGNWNARTLDPGRIASEAIARYAWLAEKPDLIHVSSLFEGMVGRAVVPGDAGSGGAALLSATAYDVIPLVFASDYLADESTRAWYDSRIDRLRRCDVLLAISESTRHDLIQRVRIPAERITTILGAVDGRFCPATDQERMQRDKLIRFGIDRPFVMYTGGIDPRKNVEGLIRAFGQLPSDLRQAYQLAIVCSVRDEDRMRLEGLARSSDVPRESLKLTGYVSDADLTALYQSCHLFVFPSRYEGFGLPVLEAMSCGAPTIAADNSSLPEIVGRRDALFRTGDDSDLAYAIARALRDRDYREALRGHALERAGEFSWQRTVAHATDAWTEAIARRVHSVRVGMQGIGTKARRPRLAMVTPLEPERSGIANFVSEWLPSLARYFEIDLFCTAQVNRDRYQALGFSVRAWEELPGCWLDYDAGVLYQVGNSEFHAHMLALLCVCPGTVLLHDAYLSGLIAYCEFGPPRITGLFDDMLAYSHPAVDRGDTDRASAIERYPMSRWVADQALGVIVTSAHALRVLRDHAQVDRARCAIVPHHRTPRNVSKDQRVAARQALGIPIEALIVCSFGRAAPRKLSIELLRAWGMTRCNRDARLIFVGEADDQYGMELRSLARTVGVNVTVTGYVEDIIFHSYMLAADLVVQLRANSRGEVSGTSLYALAYGRPLIVSRHGSAAEIPDEVCIHAESAETDALAATLTELVCDPERREALGERGRTWIRRHCDPDVTASALAAHVRRFNDVDIAQSGRRVIGQLEQLEGLVPDGSEAEFGDVVRARVARSRAPRGSTALARSIESKLRSLLPPVAGISSVSANRAEEVELAWRSKVFSVEDARLRTLCGIKDNGMICATGVGGVLMYGPYLDLPVGDYRVRMFGTSEVKQSDTTGTLEIVCQGGRQRLAARAFPETGKLETVEGLLCRVDFLVTERVTDLEFRVIVATEAQMAIESIDLVRLSGSSGTIVRPFQGL